jgi:hypothetical protein
MIRPPRRSASKPARPAHSVAIFSRSLPFEAGKWMVALGTGAAITSDHPAFANQTQHVYLQQNL